MGYQAAGDGQDLLLAAGELPSRQVLTFSQDGELLHQSIEMDFIGSQLLTAEKSRPGELDPNRWTLSDQAQLMAKRP